MPLRLKIAPRLFCNIHSCTDIITHTKDILGTLVQLAELASEHAPSALSEVCTWDLLIDKQLAVWLTNSTTAVQSHAPVTETLPVHYLHFPVRKDKPHPLTWSRSFIAACSISFSRCVFYIFFTGTLWNNSSEDSLLPKPSGTTPPSSTASVADMALNIASIRDTKWLTLEVCRQFQRGTCSRSDEECKFAHPPKSCQVENGRVIACFDSLKVRTFKYKW